MNEHREKLQGAYSVSHRVTYRDTHTNTYHVHDELEVLFVKKGELLVTVGDEKFEVSDGAILLFSPLDLHGIVPRGEIYDRYVLYFKPEFIETLSSESTRLLECFYIKNTTMPNRILPSDEAADTISSLFEKIVGCAENKADIFGKELEQKYLLGLLLIHINRLYAEDAFIPLSKRRKNAKIVYHTILYIQNHMKDDLTVRTLAAVNFIDKNTLGRVFGEMMGVTPAQYVLKARIAKAKQMLLDGYPIDEVCTHCGFGSLSHFSRTFKAQVGVSPSRFSEEFAQGAKTSE